MSNAIPQEVYFAFGKNQQADIDTANDEADLLLFGDNTMQPMPVRYNTEDDANESGKDHEFPENDYKVDKGSEHSLEYYASAELAAWIFDKALGKTAVVGASAPYTYTSTPMNRELDGCELKYFSVLQKVQSGLDQLLRGCSVAGFTLNIESGQGRATSMFTVQLMGSGRLTQPSTLSLPSTKVVPSYLPSASLALTANGVNYVTAKRINSISLSWQNGGFMRHYPGSGVEDGYGVVGSIEYTPSRGLQLQMDVDFDGTEHEIDKVRDQDEGSVVIGLTKSASEKTEITVPR